MKEITDLKKFWKVIKKFFPIKQNVLIVTNQNEVDNILNSLKGQSLNHIETSELICSGNQLTGFYMMATLVLNEFNTNFPYP